MPRPPPPVNFNIFKKSKYQLFNQIKSKTSARFEPTAFILLALPLTELRRKMSNFVLIKPIVILNSYFHCLFQKGRMSHNGSVIFLPKTKITVDKLKFMLIFAQIKMFSNLPTLYQLEDTLMNCTFTWHWHSIIHQVASLMQSYTWP